MNRDKIIIGILNTTVESNDLIILNDNCWYTFHYDRDDENLVIQTIQDHYENK